MSQTRNNDDDNPLQGHQGPGQMGMPNLIMPGLFVDVFINNIQIDHKSLIFFIQKFIIS